MRLQSKWGHDEMGVMLALPFGVLAGEMSDQELLGPDEKPLPDPEAWKQEQSRVQD